MTEIADREVRDAPAGFAALCWFAVACNLTALVLVVYWIFTARAQYIARHPEQVAIEPPTISRAISDPLIGEAFAFWVTAAGLMLGFGVLMNILVYLRAARHLEAPTGYMRLVVGLVMPACVLLQFASGIGMHTLSSFRFPDHNATHMVGSYTFFVSQIFVVLCGVLICDAALRDRASGTRLHALGMAGARMLRARRTFGLFCFGLTAAYFTLFKLKNVEFGAWNDTVYLAYVSAEPAVITCFLLFLALFQTDIIGLRRVQRLS